MVAGHEITYGHDGLGLPFGCYLERDAELLVLSRSDGSFAAAFNVGGVSRLALGAYPSRYYEAGALK